MVARHVLGSSLPDDAEVRGTGAERKAWKQLSLQRAAEVAVQRADASAAITRTLAPNIDGGLLKEYLALSDTLVRMEAHGHSHRYDATGSN